MLRTAVLACLLLTSAPAWIPAWTSAWAIVGEATPAHAHLSRHAVMVVSTAGLCTGAVLAPDLVLTAAHCVAKASKIRIDGENHGKRQHLANVTERVLHPDYSDKNPEPDLALLKLSQALRAHTPVLYRARPVADGELLTVIGYGITVAGERKTDNTPRMAMLAVSYQSSNVIWLSDRAGIGDPIISGCSGDSGAPILAARSGLPVLVAILRGSTTGCSSTTVATPLAAHYDWIMDTARKLSPSFGS